MGGRGSASTRAGSSGVTMTEWDNGFTTGVSVEGPSGRFSVSKYRKFGATKYDVSRPGELRVLGTYTTKESAIKKATELATRAKPLPPEDMTPRHMPRNSKGSIIRPASRYTAG